MKFSIVLGSFHPSELPVIIEAAEGAGLDGLCMPDHLAHPEDVAPKYPYGEDKSGAGSSGITAETPQLDPWVVGAFIAAKSTRLKFMTSVYLPVLRHPLITAKASSTLGCLLGDRFTFGIGGGWMKEEYECVGVPFKERGARLNEILDILELYWKGGVIEYHGKYYDFPRIGTNPVPSKPVPVYFGGHSEKMLERAAQRGDGWICSPKLETIDEQITTLKALRKANGREDMPFEFVGMCKEPDATVINSMKEKGITHIVIFPPWKPDVPSSDVPFDQTDKGILIKKLGIELDRFR